MLAVSLQACTEQGLYSLQSSGPSGLPPEDISALYGNTVEISVDLWANGTQFWPSVYQYYVTDDGVTILTAWHGTGPDGEPHGITHRRDEKTCMDESAQGPGESVIVCGQFSVNRNVITLTQEMKLWDTERSYSYTEQKVTTISVDANGQCRLLGRERRVLTDGRFTVPPGERRNGTCRILDGRHMTGPLQVPPS